MSIDSRSRVKLHTGTSMPVLGLGTWELTHDTAATIARALELGYSMIDTAADYGSQPGIGEGVRRLGADRDALYLVAKVEEDENAYQATRRNLGDIGLDYADLMLIHRPPPDGAGEVLWEGLTQARREGLTRDIGVSNYSVAQMRQLTELTGEKPVVNQVEWTPFGFSDELFEYCRDNRIVLQAYSPLTRGLRLRDRALGGIAGRYGKTAAQVLIRWNLQNGTVPLPKANQAGHLEENLEVFDFEIRDEDMQRLKGLNERYSSLGVLPYE